MSNKDFTKYDLIFVKTKSKRTALAKTNLPREVFKYLIENDLMTNEYFSFFNKNNFGRTWLSNKGDLLTINPQNETRYKELTVRDKTYYVSNQWQIDTITRFNEYINRKFKDYIIIKESSLIDIDSLDFS